MAIELDGQALWGLGYVLGLEFPSNAEVLLLYFPPGPASNLGSIAIELQTLIWQVGLISTYLGGCLKI